MKAHAPAVRKGCLRMRAAGASYAAVARSFGVPAGTVKAWVARARREGSWAAMQPDAAKSSKPAMQPPADVFRGITWEELPGRDGPGGVEAKKLNFAALKRGLYPPKSAGVPRELEGVKLVAALWAWARRKTSARRVVTLPGGTGLT